MVVNCANSPSTKFVPKFWWVNFFISLLNILCLKVWNIKPIHVHFLYTICAPKGLSAATGELWSSVHDFFPLGE